MNNKNTLITKKLQSLIAPSLIFVASILIYYFNFERILEIIFVTLLIWATFFVLRYFRVFKNHELQNVFINQYINKRGYKFKPKTVRQKIEDIKKIDRKSTRLNSSHPSISRMPSSA